MAYFSHEVTRDKLSLLYMLNALDIELTKQQCINIMVGNDWVRYFELVTALSELEEEGFIAAIPRPFGQAYRMTEQAHEALEMFKLRLPQTLRNTFDDYARENRSRLKRETQLLSSFKKLPTGGYMLNLRIIENANILFELNMQAPTYESAQAACDAWQEKSSDIFTYAVNALMSPSSAQ